MVGNLIDRLPWWLPALALAALAAGLNGGLARGAAYGRYVVAQGLVERRSPVLDGHLDGARRVAGGALDGVAYVNGHYYLAEWPLATWLTSPLYAVGSLAAALAPGAGWAPGVVGLFGPLLLLAALLGVARLADQVGPGRRRSVIVTLVTMLVTPLLAAAIEQSVWLVPLSILLWLLVGMRWTGRVGLVGHGLLGGLLVGCHPWFAPAAIMALVVTRSGLLWRGLGLVVALAPVAGWQWALFGRPWRLADAFLVLPAAVVPTRASLLETGIILLFVVPLVVINRRWRWPLLVAVLAVGGTVGVAGAPTHAGLLSVGIVVIAVATLVATFFGGGGQGWRGGSFMSRTAIGGSLVGLAWFTYWNAQGLNQTLLRSLVVDVTLGQRLLLAGLVVLGGVGLARWPLARRGGLALAGVLVAGGWLMAGAPPVRAQAPSAGASLVPPFTATAPADGQPLTLWRLVLPARLEGERLVLPAPEATAASPVVAARPGERYCAVAEPPPPVLVLVWEDDRHRVVAEHGGQAPPGPLCFAAPPGASGVRLRLAGGPTAPPITRARLWADGPRLAPLPDYATAALAFTFDWESVMGGPIHSKGGAGGYEGERTGPGRDESSDPLAVAVERGARMRRGAEVLADLFRPHGIRATFYATGYNLLTGNPERRQFVGGPTYRWANRRNGWGSDYWVTHPWYGDDPFGTETTHPEWYYGGLTRQLAAEGHEIEPHTFGHLYVRGATPDELARDLAEWNAAAAALGLPGARSFAFPWRSSNSVQAPHLSRLTAAGIGSLTRVYQLRLGAEYELDAAEDLPELIIYPDYIFPSTPAGGLAARRVIDEVVLRRGYQSLWTHPEEVVDAEQVAAWRAVVDYAAAARGRGLWVAPLVEIVGRVRAGRAVEVISLRDGGATRLRVTNTGPAPVSGVVIEFDGPALADQPDQPWLDRRDTRLRLPPLASQATIAGLARRAD